MEGKIGITIPRLGHVDVESIVYAVYYVRHGRTEHGDLQIRHTDVARCVTMDLVIVRHLVRERPVMVLHHGVCGAY